MSSELSLEQCSKRLVALIVPHRRITLVVDAVDECENHKVTDPVCDWDG